MATTSMVSDEEAMAVLRAVEGQRHEMEAHSDISYVRFLANLEAAITCPEVRVPAGIALGMARFKPYRGEISSSFGINPLGAVPGFGNIARVVIQPYVVDNPIVVLRGFVGGGLLGPVNRPYISNGQLGTRDFITRSWQVPKHTAPETGFLGWNNWNAQNFATADWLTFPQGFEGSYTMDQSLTNSALAGDFTGPTLTNVLLINDPSCINILPEDIPEYLGQSMADAGFGTTNSGWPGAYIPGAADNGTAVEGVPGEFNAPRVLQTVYPFNSGFPIAEIPGGMIVFRVIAANGAIAKVAHVGQNQVKQFGVHTLDLRSDPINQSGTAVTPGGGGGDGPIGNIAKFEAAFENSIWTNETDYFFERDMVVMGSLAKVAGFDELISGADQTVSRYYCVPFAGPKAGLTALHPKFVQYFGVSTGADTAPHTTADGLFVAGGCYPTGYNKDSMWEVTMGWNDTAMGQAPYTGTRDGSLMSGGVNTSLIQFPASTYPTNAVWTGTSNASNTTTNPYFESALLIGLGTTGVGRTSYRQFPLYIPGGDGVQVTAPTDEGWPLQPLLQQFISVVGGRRRLRACNSVSQSLYGGYPQFEVNFVNALGSVTVEMKGKFFYNMMVNNSNPFWTTSVASRQQESDLVAEARMYAGARGGTGHTALEAVQDYHRASHAIAQRSRHPLVRGMHGEMNGKAPFVHAGTSGMTENRHDGGVWGTIKSWGSKLFNAAREQGGKIWDASGIANALGAQIPTAESIGNEIGRAAGIVGGKRTRPSHGKILT